MNERKEKFHFYGIIVWFFAILFYFYEFFLRVLPATISANILHDLDISLSKFAIISSAYYISYSAMQMPVGVLTDRFGPRILSFIGCIVCSIGVIGFAFSDNFYNIVISRFLIGIGSSFGFISLLVLTFNWFPHKYFGFLGGLSQTLGAIGPLFAGVPVIYMMNVLNNDWRLIFMWVAFFGVILSVCIFIFVRNKPARLVDEIVFVGDKRNLIKDLKILMSIPQVWITMFYSGFIYVSLPMLGAYWGTLYLRSRGFSEEKSSFMVSMIWIGLAIGSPLFGRISDRIKRRKPVLSGLAFFGVFVSLILLFFPIKSEWIISVLLGLVGIAAGGQSLAFALITEYVPSELKATAIGANNTVVMLFAALFPVLSASIMQFHQELNYSFIQSDFTEGLLLMPISYALAGLICLFGTKETFCRQQQDIHHT